jgi:hypothetical protein
LKRREMNSLAEKLVESWLDSQTERRYQSAFIQMLVARRWTVLHNTRHSPIEFGKDVIARAPDGTLYAFQLKGNPGSRLRKSETQGILPQIIELISAQVPSVYLKTNSEKFVAVLVTNGEVDEEANLLLTQTTASIMQGTLPASAFEIWSRGRLLADLSETISSIWPTSVEGMRKILNLNACSGLDIAPIQDIAEALQQINLTNGQPKNEPARMAAITSILLLLEIMKSPWREKENHYSLFLISVLGLVHCLPLTKTKKSKTYLSAYEAVILRHAVDLLEDARNHGYDPDYVWGQRDLFSEIDMMSERRRLLADCAAAIIISGAEVESGLLSYSAQLISVSVDKPVLWGFGAVPAFIVRWWALNKLRVGIQSELTLAKTLNAVLRISDRRNSSVRGMPAPYYSFEQCWPWWRDERNIGDDQIFLDSFRSRVWFGRAMLFMLAKRNLKQICKRIWPDFSRQNHEEAELPGHTFFSPIVTQEGSMRTFTFHGENWNNLVATGVEAGEAAFLEDYTEFSWVIAAYVSIAPHRAWTSVLMWLDTTLNETWYNARQLPR